MADRGDGMDGPSRTTEEEARAAAAEAMERITFEGAADGHSLLMALARIEAEELGRDGHISDGDNGTLLVVDSASSVLSHHLSGDRLGPALLEQAGLTLRHLARTLDGRFDPDDASAPPRRFAVLVTNGSVARRGGGLGGPCPGPSPAGSSNKPAMGRYWRAADVGVWVEEDGRREGGTAGDAAAAGGPTSVAGLAVEPSRVATATLVVHRGKSCRVVGDVGGGERRGPSAAFVIGSGGVGD